MGKILASNYPKLFNSPHDSASSVGATDSPEPVSVSHIKSDGSCNISRNISPVRTSPNQQLDMRTTVMVDRLRAMSSNQTTASSNSSQATLLYTKLRQSLLSKKMVLANRWSSEPNKHHKAGATSIDALPPITLTLKHLFSSLGGKFTIKGSTVTKLDKLNATLDASELNDIDIAIAWEQSGRCPPLQRLASIIRTSLPKPYRSISDDQLLAAYTRDTRQETGWLKVRLNVAAASIPIDIVFYTDLAAAFDSLDAANQIEVDMNIPQAIPRETIDDTTRLWLNHHQLIWLHEDMDGGLDRVQYRFSKLPTLTCLQPDIVGHHYDRANRAEQARFVFWLITKPPTVPDHLLLNAIKPLFKPLICETVNDKLSTELQAAMIYWLKQSPALAPAIHQEKLDPAQLDNPSTAGAIIAAIKQGFNVFISAKSDLKLYLEIPTTPLPTTQTINALFPPPDTARLRSLWSDTATTRNQAVQWLLLPATLQATENRDDADEALMHHLNLWQAKSTGSIEDEMSVLIAKSQHPASDETAQKEALAQAIALFKAQANTHIKNNAPPKVGSETETTTDTAINLLNQLTPLSLSSKQLQRIEPELKTWLEEPVVNITQHTQLSSASKSIILLMQLKHAGLEAKTKLLTADTHPSYAELQTHMAKVMSIMEHESILTDSPNADRLIHQGSLKKGGGYCSILFPEISLHYEDGLGCYIGECRSVKVGSEKRVRPHGIGLLWSGEQAFIKGKFNKGQLHDSKGQIYLPQGLWTGSVASHTLNGEGLLTTTLASLPTQITSLIFPLLAADPDQQQIENLDVAVSGRFTGEIGQPFVDAPWQQLSAGKVSFEVSDTKTNASDGVALLWQQGKPTDILISPLRGSASHLLRVLVTQDQTQDDTLAASNDGLSANYNKVQLDLSEHDRTIFAPYDPAQRSIAGNGIIMTPSERYFGGILGTNMHGYGHIKKYEEPFGHRIFTEQGQLIDPDLDNFRQDPRLIPDSWPEIVFLRRSPYAMPQGRYVGLFSMLGPHHEKIYGVWNPSLIFGVLRAQERESLSIASNQPNGFTTTRPYEYAGLIRSYPQSLIDQIAPQLGNPDERYGLTFSDKEGTEHCFYPHGLGEMRLGEQERGKHQWFFLGRPVGLEYEEFKDGSTVCYPAEQPDWNYMTNVRGLVDRDYEGELLWDSTNGVKRPVLHGNGKLYLKDTAYQGTFLYGQLHGETSFQTAGGIKFEGIFAYNSAYQGTITYPSGVTIETMFSSQGAEGTATIQIPTDKEQTTTYTVQLRGSAVIHSDETSNQPSSITSIQSLADLPGNFGLSAQERAILNIQPGSNSPLFIVQP